MSGTLSSALRGGGLLQELCGNAQRESKLPSGNSPSWQLGLDDVGPVGALPPAVERNLISQVLCCG